MSDVSFVFSNPGHHLAMLAPVARLLRDRGVACQLLSLAELRGFHTPPHLDPPARAVIPFKVRRSPSMGAGTGGSTSGLRGLARMAVAAVMIPLIRHAVGKSRVVVVPNDSAFPYDRLVTILRRSTTVVLVQEGIRFAMPNGDAYGLGGCTKICAWGEGSREYFVTRGAPSSSVVVTGSPRHDGFDPRTWADQGQELMRKLGLARRPLALLSNPIEHQGYGRSEDKLALFERFLCETEPLLRARGLALLVKNHAYEDPASYARVAARTPAADVVRVEGGPLFSALAASAGAIVLTSTAGLEALMFGVPIGALELPNKTFGFEYVDRGAAVGLRVGHFADGLRELLDQADARRSAGEMLVDRHLHDRGHATANVADVIQGALAARPSPGPRVKQRRSRGAPRTA